MSLTPHPTSKLHGYDLYLAPSPIHGVGVFTRVPIPAGELVYNAILDETVVYLEEQIERMEPSQQEAIRNFGVWLLNDPECVAAPANWSMSPIWYLNHSRTPNLVCQLPEYEYYAARDIAVGEELTVDYRTIDRGKGAWL